jgi:periplasmic protein TonB
MIRKPPRKNPRQRLPGIAIVVLLHIGIGYALLNGLGRKVIEQVLDEPLLVSLIEQPKHAPPAEPTPPTPATPPAPSPPPVARPAPPKLAPTPMSTPTPASVVVTPEPVSSVTIAPTPQPAPAPPAPPAPPVTSSVAPIAVVCANHASVRSSVPYPGMARRRNVEGTVVAEFVVGTSGRIEESHIASSASPLFDEAVLEAVQRFRCTGQASPVRIRVSFEFSLK